jgi:hypothetical protein
MATFFPKLALASAIVAAATLPASAQTFVAVIFTTPVKYYASLDDYASPGAMSRRGQTEIGMHLCVADQLIRYRDTKFAQLFLPDGQVVYMDFAEAAGDYTLDPANNKKCRENAALYVQQAAQSARRNRVSSSPVAASQSPQVQSKPVAPNYGSSGAGATTFIDDAMRADLKEVLAPNGTQVYPNGISDILAIPNLVALRANTVGNYFFWRNHDNGNNQEIHWSSDKDMQDFVKARRWYQFSLFKEKSATPNSDWLNDEGKIKSCDFALSNESGSARSEVGKEKRQEQAEAQERQRKLAARKKVGDCVVIPGGTGFLGLGSTMGTVTIVSGDTISWVAHLHRNGHSAPALFGGSYYVAPQDFDREGSSKYDEVSLCDQH